MAIRPQAHETSPTGAALTNKMRALAVTIVAWWILCGANPVFAETFPATDVKRAGSIQYGETTPEMKYDGTARFTALAFNGRPGDHLEITVHSTQGKWSAYLVTAAYESIAGGTNRFNATLPRDSEPATYYILISEQGRHPGSFRVDLERPSRDR